jgi:uncharacterized protein YbjT (DUF2867 family)
MILITGATGTNGSEIIKQLVAQGASVRALVRNPAKATTLEQLGVEVVQGDFNELESLVKALDGVEKALMLPPIAENAVELQRNFIEAAKKTKTQHIVKFSGMGASPDAPIALGRSHGIAEKLLEESGIAYTHLRPTAFMQNTLGLAPTIISEGVFYQPAGDGKISHVDVRDIAAVAVKVLTEDGHTGKAYDITGPEALSFDEVAAKIAAVIGKPVKYVNIPVENFKQALLNWGQPEWSANAIAELYEQVYQKGWASTVTETIATVAKKNPTTFAQFVQDYRQVFLGS